MPALPYQTKGNTKATAAEKLFHIHIMENNECMGCGKQATQVHHPLDESPNQEGRRDHRFVVPVCPHCHTEIHDKYGNETKWAESKGCELPIRFAEFLMIEGVSEGWI